MVNIDKSVIINPKIGKLTFKNKVFSKMGWQPEESEGDDFNLNSCEIEEVAEPCSNCSGRGKPRPQWGNIRPPSLELMRSMAPQPRGRGRGKILRDKARKVGTPTIQESIQHEVKSLDNENKGCFDDHTLPGQPATEASKVLPGSEKQSMLEKWLHHGENEQVRFSDPGEESVPLAVISYNHDHPSSAKGSRQPRPAVSLNKCLDFMDSVPMNRRATHTSSSSSKPEISLLSVNNKKKIRQKMLEEAVWRSKAIDPMKKSDSESVNAGSLTGPESTTDNSKSIEIQRSSKLLHNHKIQSIVSEVIKPSDTESSISQSIGAIDLQVQCPTDTDSLDINDKNINTTTHNFMEISQEFLSGTFTNNNKSCRLQQCNDSNICGCNKESCANCNDKSHLNCEIKICYDVTQGRETNQNSSVLEKSSDSASFDEDGSSHVLVLENLPDECCITSLLDILGTYGEVKDCDLDPNTLTAKIIFYKKGACEWAQEGLDGEADFFPDSGKCIHAYIQHTNET